MNDARNGAERERRGWVGPALVVVWGITLVVAFAFAHASQPYSIEASVSAADGPGLLSSVAAAARALVCAVAILGAASGYGGLIVRFVLGSLGFGRTADRCGELMLGGGLLALAVFGFGHARLLTPVPSLLLVGVGLVALVAGRFGRVVPDEPRHKIEPDRTTFDPVIALALAGIGVAFLLALVTALAPPTARDALAYHLAVPKAYVAANAIVELPWNVLSYTPFATEMLFTLGLVIGPDTTPSLVHLGFGVAVVVLAFVVTRRTTDSARWASVAAVIVASVPSVVWNAGIAHNEMWLALALTVACLAIGRWWENRDARLLLWCGAAIGIALAGKHTAMLLAPILALVVLLRARPLATREQIRTLGMAAVAAVVAIAIPLPWYIQNVARTRNPLFPFFWGVFPTQSQVWESTRAELLDAYLRQSYGQADGILAWLRLPWDVSIRAQNDVTALFDGVLGPVYLFLAPIVVFAIARSSVQTWLRISTIVAGSFLVIWATQSQQIRFLVPVLPVLAIAGCAASAGIVALKRSPAWTVWATGIVLAAMVAFDLSIAGAGVLSTAPYRPVLGIESRASYLTRRIPYFPFYVRLNNEIGPTQRVLLVNMRNDGYYLDVPFVSDSVFEDYTVGRIVNEATTPSDVRTGIELLGATHVLVREDILLDPRFTPFVDAAASARWSGFLQSSADRLESRDGITLYALKN